MISSFQKAMYLFPLKEEEESNITVECNISHINNGKKNKKAVKTGRGK